MDPRQEKRATKDLAHQERNKRIKKIQSQRKKEEPAVVKKVPGVAGIITGVHGHKCLVRIDGEQMSCTPLSGMAIGDNVMVSLERRAVMEILPRRSALSRPDPHNPNLEKIIAANVDVVVIVASIRSPDFRPGLVDRYLIAIEKGRATPMLCVNKVDLGGDMSALEPYRQAGIPVFACSASSGEGIPELEEALAGKVCVFVGHSGVGKSSLLNALRPELELATTAVTEGNEKGQHTTTSSSIYEITGGAQVIDTPGVREFGLWDLTVDELRRYFHEFDPYAPQCRYRDCGHRDEPRCAVLEAVERGEIPRERHSSYLRLMESLKGETQ